MGILLNKKSKVLVQGITGKEGRFWTKYMLESGTNIVAGVTPGRKGEVVEGISVFDTVQETHRHLDFTVDISVVFVPAPFAKDAVFEAIEENIKKIVLLTDGLPKQDALEVKAFANDKRAMVIGPNTVGVANVGEAMIGFFPIWLKGVYKPGVVGFVSRSGSLSNEIASQISASGYGLSTCVDIGGDPFPCTVFTDILELFEKDDKTRAVVLVGELGGTFEEEAAQFIRKGKFTKPVVSYIVGKTAPQGKRMGHAGAIIVGNQGLVYLKQKALKEAGVLLAQEPSQIGELLRLSLSD